MNYKDRWEDERDWNREQQQTDRLDFIILAVGLVASLIALGLTAWLWPR